MKVASRKANQKADDRDNSLEAIVEDAERSFVTRDYHKALELSSDAIDTALNENSVDDVLQQQQDQNCLVRLQTRGLLNPLSQTGVNEATACVVSMVPVSLMDRAAAILLQSVYELSCKEMTVQDTAAADGSSFLSPLLELYKLRPMPFQMAVMWIQFLFKELDSRGKHVAVDMAGELIHQFTGRPDCQTAVSSDLDGLTFAFVTEMLPYCQDEDYVRHVLESLQRPSWTPPSELTATYVHAGHVNPKAPSIVLDSLDSFSQQSIACMGQCRESLEVLVGEASTQDTKVEGLQEDDVLMTFSSRPHIRWKQWRKLSKEAWITALCMFRLRVLQPLYHDERKWENCRHLAIATLLFYVAWKNRQRLSPFTTAAAKAMVKLITAPFREVLEALMPPR